MRDKQEHRDTFFREVPLIFPGLLNRITADVVRYTGEKEPRWLDEEPGTLELIATGE